MNRQEYTEILRATEIYKPAEMIKNEYCKQEWIHYLGDLGIWFNGSDSATVKGKVPLEMVKILDDKYPYRYRIHPDYRTQTKKYVEGFRIKTGNGLLAFILEMKDYYLRKNNLKETEVQRFYALKGEVANRLIEMINPNISAYDWMQGESCLDYNASIERDSKSVLGKIFRDEVTNFDKVINPFLDDTINIDDAENYVRKVNIHGIASDDYNGRYRRGCCYLIIVEDGTRNTTFYERNAKGFKFQLVCNYDSSNELTVSHYYTTDGESKFDRGEIIEIEDTGNRNNNIRYNATKGLVGRVGELKTPVTLEQFDIVCGVLKKATEYASNITVKNMKSNGKTNKKTQC